MKFNSFHAYIILSLIFGFVSIENLYAESKPQPEVLTLEYALQQASVDHPSLQLAAAELDKAKAKQLIVDSTTNINTKISARLRWVDPPEIAYDQSSGDHKLSLFVNKKLYDFGFTKALMEAAEAGVVNREHYYQHSLNQHRISIMAAFFDVLLADYVNGRNEEDVKITFLYADRAKDRNELGMVSDIVKLETWSVYQASRTRLHKSRARQRTARAALANILNSPDDLPSELSEPELLGNNRNTPDSVDEWLVIAEQKNPLLNALQAKIVSSQKYLASAKETTGPVLSSEIEVSSYAREAGGYDNWRAGVVLDVPLPTSGKTDAAVASTRADLKKAKAEYEQQRRMVRQDILEAWSDLNTLKIERDRVESVIDFRDLYLDRSRALYQLEVKTDFGDAMIRAHEAHIEKMKHKFSTALTWARVEALLGKTVSSGNSVSNTANEEGAP